MLPRLSPTSALSASLRALSLLTALAGLHPAANAQSTAAAAAPTVTLRWAAQNDILTLDPHSQNHSTTSAILMHA